MLAAEQIVLFGSVSPYTPAAQSFFARLSTQPSDARKALYNALFTAIAGLPVDALWLLAAADAATARTNLISASFGLTEVSAPTFTTDRGYTGNGTSSYLKTGFVPSTAGGNYGLNSASVGVWSLTAGASGGSFRSIGATDGIESVSFSIRTGADSFSSFVNEGAIGTVSNTLTDGFFTISRTSSSGWDISRNASSLATISHASVGLPTSEIFLCALDSTGSPLQFDAKQYAAAFIAGGLSAGQLTTLYNALHTYLQGVGAV